MLTPYPFQTQGIEWLTTRKTALLADTMGLGKSMQALIAADEIDAERVLVIAPKATMTGWQREATEWVERDLQLVDKPKMEIPKQGWVLVPWSRIAARREEIVGQEWDVVVVDEAHFGKSGRGADRAIAAYGIWTKNEKTGKWTYTKGATDVGARVWLLTGTPMPNRPIELLPLVKALKMPWAKKSRDFTDRYCSQPNQWSKSGRDNLGAKNLDELHDRLVSDCMLRRTPENVPGQLPDVITTTVCLAGNRATASAEKLLSDEARKALKGWTGDTGMPGFDEMSAYRRELGDAKAKAVADWADEWLRVNEREALVIFGHHQSFCEAVAERLSKYEPIVAHGGNAADSAVRQGKVDAFANAEPGKHRVFIGTTGACGTGMNGLHKRTGCCAFGEMEWTPGEYQQAIGRVRRLGGVGASCNVFYIVVESGMEGHIVSTVAGKIAHQQAAIESDATCLDDVPMPPPQVVDEEPEVEVEVEPEYPVVDDPATLTWGWTKDRRTGAWMIRVSHPGQDEWQGATVTVTKRDGSNPKRRVLGERRASGDHNGGWSMWDSEDAPPTEEEQAERDANYLHRRFGQRSIAGALDTQPLDADQIPQALAAADAAQLLTGMDGDKAAVKNGVGWNKADGMMGRILAGTPVDAWDKGLLAGAKAILRKYRSTQLGSELWDQISPEEAQA